MIKSIFVPSACRGVGYAAVVVAVGGNKANILLKNGGVRRER